MIGEKGGTPGPTAVDRARDVRTRRSRRRASLARASTGDAIVDARVSRLETRVSRVDASSRGRWRRRWWRRRWAAARARDESSDDDDDDDARERASTFEGKMRQVCRRLARDRELVGDVDAGRR